MSYTNKSIELAKSLANQFHNSKSIYNICLPELLKWIGIDNIFVSKNHDSTKIIEKYTTINGDYNMLKFIDNNTISYKDHVSRIKTTNGLLPEAIYTFPNLTNTNAEIYDIINSPKYISKTAFQTVTKLENTLLTEIPEPFAYDKMENGKGLEHPISLGYPNFLLNIDQLPNFENVLHLPIKINVECEEKFNKEGRIDCN